MQGNALMNVDRVAHTKSGGSAARRPNEVASELRVRLRQVIDADPDGGRVLRRLRRASTSVEFLIGGDASASVTLLLDREPPRVADRPEPAEIRLELSVEQAERFAQGRLNMPTSLYTGAIAFEGPVRSYLAVDPVLRRLLEDACHS